MIKRKKLTVVFLLTIIFCWALTFWTQDTLSLTNSAQAQSTSLVAAPATSVPGSIEVTDVYRFHTDDTNKLDRHRIALNDVMIVKINNFKSYYQNILCKDKNSSCNPSLILNLDGRRIAGILPKSLVFEQEQGILSFQLRRDSTNEDTWADLLRNPTQGASFSELDIKASVSLADGGDATPLAISKSFRLVRFRWEHLIFWLLLIGCLFLSLRSQFKHGLKNLVRENGPEPEIGSKPYSLGRCQMAWWSFWIFFAYISIYMVTGANDTLNEGVLGLLGIGAGTALGAALIDQDDNSEVRKSQGFWKDILNSREQNGPGLHRLQLILWTIILTVVFVVSVGSRLSMPQFSSTLLALQGIVSGTYLGFKFPENSQDK
jgi:hypothetical protein